ncbi:MAPEG family protein [Litoribrevibacter euphylliae]|uniref:MAPEG family protein n=1 Tax=Litoribrevibacter euphylliae TaxID=1834034 RepID=A0ABV7HGD1_9GAMM
MILTTSTSIFYPAFAMFVLTMLCLLSLGIARLISVRTGKVKISFYRTYNKGEEPEYLHLLSRHVRNHFEIPPLFYIGVLFAYVTHSVSDTAIAFAWAFVITRLIHSAIHLTINNVTYRFLAFGLGLICLTGLWVTSFLTLL